MNSFDLLSNTYRLDIIDRWSGLYVTQRENVSQHSYHVACIASLLAMIEITVFNKMIDIEVLLLNALFHDIADSKLTHITYDVKNINEQLCDAVHNTKKEIINSLIGHESNDDSRNHWYVRFLASNKNVRYLIEIADVIDAMLFAKREVERSNCEFNEIFERQKKQLQRLKSKYECVSYFEKHFLHGG